MKTWSRFVMGAIMLLLLIGCGCARVARAQNYADGSFQRTLNVSGPVELDVSTGSGRIEIHAGTSSRVEVHGRIRAYDGLFGTRDVGRLIRDIESDPPIEQSGNVIRIGRTDRFSHRDHVSISYEITVPANTRARSRTGSGSQEIAGIEGPVDATTGSGSIRITNVRSVSANTGSGQIVAEDVKGALRARTGSGGIKADGDLGDRWDLSTGSGPVVVRLPQQAAFDLDAHTSSGSVTVDHPITVSGRLRRNEVSGRVRGGGVALDVRTGSGSIRIE